MKTINLVKFIFLSIIACVLVIFAFKTGYVSESDNLEIVFLDVGQGDCAYIKTPDNYRILIDSGDEGSYKNKIKNFLGERNVNKLDACLVSHFHEDHYYGIYEMMGQKDIDCVYMPRVDEDNLVKELLKFKTDEFGIKCISLSAGDVIYNGKDGVKISALFPDKSVYVNYKKVENNDTLVLLVEYKGKKILFTGDLEADAQKYLAKAKDVDADILKVAHHGSKDALYESFIDEASPVYSIISCGADNVFSFPHDVVIDKLAKQNSKIYRTDINGDITFIIDDNGEIKVQTAR